MSQNIYIYIYICKYIYTGCFMTCGHYCRSWFPRSLWSKISHKHVSDFGRLWNYGHFLNFRTCPHVNRVLPCQLAGDVLNLEAYHLHYKHNLPPDLSTQLQSVQFPYLETLKVFKECREVGWLCICMARVYCISQLLLRVQKPLSLTLQWLCRLLMFRTVRR